MPQTVPHLKFNVRGAETVRAEATLCEFAPHNRQRLALPPSGCGRSPFTRTGRGQLPASFESVICYLTLAFCRLRRRRRYGRGKREGDHRVTQRKTVPGSPPKP